MENFVLDYPVLSHRISNNLWSRVWYKSENCSFGPFIIKVISIPIFYILNAVGWVVSGVAIKKGYANELSKSRTVTLALLIGIIIGYILGNIIPLE